MIRFDARLARPILKAQLTARGVSDQSSHHVADSLLETSLRGVDSHGINLFPYYVHAVEGGRINRAPEMTIVKRRSSSAVLDGDHGFGHHAGSVAIELAMQMATESGIGIVAVRHSTHFGAAAYFAHQASRRGYAAFAFTNADALVKAYGGKEPFFGSNPICFAVPMANEEPFCLDMSTSRVSWNKVVNKRRGKETMPDGWASDEHGEPTTEPVRAKMLEPLGDYKGFGLGMMVEILCAGLSDGPFDRDILPMYGSPLSERRNISHCFMAINIQDFVEIGHFTERMRSLATRLRAISPSGAEPVMAPGDPEKRAAARRLVDGIPVDAEKYEEFLRVSESFRKAVVP